ncbi:beta-D-hydroxybutyrate dehydrogenase [Sphingomonas panacis]|uniref:Beta-D-hydroxybutyrate dehydrogenase n=1 Tax=Sphingomonas panacis TaxID=1560345 RepID=A0A1B3Z647_9SPHN|nr:SDR family NAD(P)-dependent oxidoreductase [Sphingomonas panacis]AOH82899.1 beta-D-hydroxybutyrate dehydrogenase [Sphingomonas panacis]
MREPVSLAGRSALITGSVGGLGLAMARALASAGVSVVLTGLDPAENIESVRQQITTEFGVAARYVEADLTDPDAIRTLVARASDGAPIDILVNNAVVRHFAPVCDLALEDWNRALAVNLTAALLATQLVLPGMRARNYGRVFNMTSVYGSRGTVNRIDYVTTKTAIQGMTRAIALETAGSGVTCHALTPGSVRTPIWGERIDETVAREGISREEAEQRFLDGKQPSGRFIEEDSVAEVLLMLCGPVGEDMNGAILPIEGGWLARG